MDYFDEQGIESLAKKNDIPETKESGESSNKNKSSIISRKVTMEGVELFTDEYSINHTQDSDENFQVTKIIQGGKIHFPKTYQQKILTK